MLWSKFFIPTIKEIPVGAEAVSHQLLLRAGLVSMLTSGVYSYLPLGLRVIKKIESIIREEMNAAGAHELLMPALHPLEIWQQTGRDKTLQDVMFHFQNKKGQPMCLGPTHEEIITTVIKSFVHSYRQLPVTLYQIQTKFRDETRPRFGVIRSCEFIMKDAYSFDIDATSMNKSYAAMFAAYKNIFRRCGLDPIIVEADSGAMGGSLSQEFLVPAAIGEDKACDASGKEHSCIEVGHIFQLGQKYSMALSANVMDENGKQQPVVMGCYGIGVSRLMATVIESHNDAAGITWPLEIAPFSVEILPLQILDEEVMATARDIYGRLTKMGIDVLMDDRDESAGRKFNDADLIGLPFRVIIGKRSLQSGCVEIKIRSTGEGEMVPKDLIIDKLALMVGK